MLAFFIIACAMGYIALGFLILFIAVAFMDANPSQNEAAAVIMSWPLLVGTALIVGICALPYGFCVGLGKAGAAMTRAVRYARGKNAPEVPEEVPAEKVPAMPARVSYPWESKW